MLCTFSDKNRLFLGDGQSMMRKYLENCQVLQRRYFKQPHYTFLHKVLLFLLLGCSGQVLEFFFLFFFSRTVLGICGEGKKKKNISLTSSLNRGCLSLMQQVWWYCIQHIFYGTNVRWCFNSGLETDEKRILLRM